MSIAPYKTLMKRASDSFIVNKSRFIGHGAPVESEEEALGFLAEMRREYQDASHNCYAYIIGTNMGIMRYNDDGEPGGTAGMPIIEVMKARGVTNAIVVVTRYFGGILLGAGGLVRAYTQGAAMALNAAQVAVMHPTQRLLVDVPYPLLGRFEHFLKSAPVRVEDKAFTDTITFTLCVRSADAETFERSLIAHTDGRCEPLSIEEFHSPWPEEVSARS